MDKHGFVKRLYQCVDERDVKTLSQFLSDDILFQMGNGEPVRGKQDVVAANEGFFKSIADMSHVIDGIWIQDEHVICNGTVSYIRLDNSTYGARFATILKLEHELINDYRVYADLSEL